MALPVFAFLVPLLELPAAIRRHRRSLDRVSASAKESKKWDFALQGRRPHAKILALADPMVAFQQLAVNNLFAPPVLAETYRLLQGMDSFVGALGVTSTEYQERSIEPGQLGLLLACIRPSGRAEEQLQEQYRVGHHEPQRHGRAAPQPASLLSWAALDEAAPAPARAERSISGGVRHGFSEGGNRISVISELCEAVRRPGPVAHIEDGGKRNALPRRTATRTCELALVEYRSHPQGMRPPSALAGALDRLAAIMVRLVPRPVLEYRRDGRADDDSARFERESHRVARAVC